MLADLGHRSITWAAAWWQGSRRAYGYSRRSTLTSSSCGMRCEVMRDRAKVCKSALHRLKCSTLTDKLEKHGVETSRPKLRYFD